jgi:hypothetical protein
MAKLKYTTLFRKTLAGLKIRQAALEESKVSRALATAANSRKSSLHQRPRQIVSMTAPINPTEVIVFC